MARKLKESKTLALKDIPETDQIAQTIRSKVLQNGIAFDPEKYEYDHSFKPANINNPFEVHTTAEMVASLAENKNIELDAKVLYANKNGKISIGEITKDRFIESFKSTKNKLKEADDFATDQSDYSSRVGEDFVPILGGPFYKNLYFYQDYIRMHGQAFFAYHHDPIAKMITEILHDFTIGGGFKVECHDEKYADRAMLIWKAFEETNNLPELMSDFAREISIYGEDILWWLPNKETKITYQLRDKDQIPRGMIPRVRLVDPSNIVEIVTYPEDITRRLFYVWLAPTQYQIYTGSGQTDKVQPSLKYIYRQIPADQMMHFKINSVSNEKRGRSDYYPVLGYLKCLRDSVNYGLVAQQKQAAWAIDTSIEGSQADIDAYTAEQQAIGTIAPAGSEFVHSAKVKREFLSNAAAAKGNTGVFDWCLSMIAAGVQIPISYFGTHLSGGQTRASALVSTEPVAKKFEMRRQVYKRAIRSMWDRLMKEFGLPPIDCEIIFPELITQDRSAKLKDLALAESQGWISKKRAAQTAAKEFDFDDFDFEDEQVGPVVQDDPLAPLTTPPAQDASGISGEEKRKIKINHGY